MAYIVVAATPLAGHVMPMAQIGAHLKNVGHEVIMLTAEQYQGAAIDSRLSFAPLAAGPTHQPPDATSLPNRVLPALMRRYLWGRAEMHSLLVAPLAAEFEALTAVLAERPVDAVLADVAFTGVLPLLLGRRPRPPVLVCGVGPLSLSSDDVPPFGMAWQPRPSTDYRAMNRVVQQRLFGGVQKQLDGALRAVGAPRCPTTLLDWPLSADWMLELTVAGLEYPRRDLAPTVEFIGPVLPGTTTDFTLPRWWDAVLDAETVVLVTQGTLDNSNGKQLLEPTVSALANEDVVVVVTTGRSGFTRLGVSTPNAYVAEWIPYQLLMPHVDVFVTNGGYGGVQHALSHGVPIIVAGETSDKAEVGARVAYSGAGIKLNSVHPRAADISAAVREVVHNGRYRVAAQRLRDEISQSDALGAVAALVAAITSAPGVLDRGSEQPDLRTAF